MIDRRKFLQNLGGFSAAFLLNKANIYGAAANEKKLSKIGLQLYTVRRDLERDFEGTLQKIAALGIDEVEFAGYFNRSPKQIKSLLKELKLAAPSAHIGTEVLRKNLSQAVAEAKEIGHEYLVLGYVPEEERKTPDDYQKLIELLNKSGAECRKSDLQFAYHNHDFEFKKMPDKIAYDLILAETDKDLVKMELDLYWISKAGFDPLAYFEKHPNRFPLIHVKDMDNTPQKYFTEVGRGTIDFKKIFAVSTRGGVRHFFIEQDETPAAPLASIETSLRYLRGLNF